MGGGWSGEVVERKRKSVGGVALMRRNNETALAGHMRSWHLLGNQSCLRLQGGTA